MAFRRPADSSGSTSGKSSSVEDDSVPIVLKLPALGGAKSEQAAAASLSPPRPWIGVVMWCVTGALAILAAVLIFTGKQETPAPTEEAPRWQADSPTTLGSNAQSAAPFAEPDASFGQSGTTFGQTPPLADERSTQPVEQALPTPGAPPTFDERELPDGPNAGYRANPNAAPNYQGGPPRGGQTPYYPPVNYQPAGGAPGGSESFGQPAVGSGAAPGYGGQGGSDMVPPDQSKLHTDLRTATRPPAPGGARLDGGIQYLDVRPRNDSGR
jgi:hypothetical protein